MDTSTTKALCWIVTRKDSTVLRGTTLDRDVVVTASGFAGTYPAAQGIAGSSIKSSDDLSVDNLEINGAIFTAGVKDADIQAGLYDGAAVTIFETDWTAPSSVTVLRAGTLGNLKRTFEGAYTAEIRGLSQNLSQTISAVYQISCRAALGSASEVPSIRRCGVDLTAFTFTSTVTGITTADREFTDSALLQAAGYFQYGKVTFTSGANAGFTKAIKRHQAGGIIDLSEPMPYDIAVGDAYTIIAGCDKQFATCKGKFNNSANFRGEPYIPGNDVLFRIVTE